MITVTQAAQKIIQYGYHIDVIPVLVIDDVSIAVDLAKVLIDVGMPTIEVTLRTAEALSVIEKMAAVDGAIIAAGTVLYADQIISAQSAGAKFLVSPGYTDALGDEALSRNLPLLPGAATATEIMLLVDKGYKLLKFFPASVNGGVPALKAITELFPDVSFCPTGGLNNDNVDDYLALNNVPFVGGSWLVTKRDMMNKDWTNVQKKVKALTKIINP